MKKLNDVNEETKKILKYSEKADEIILWEKVNEIIDWINKQESLTKEE